MNDIDQAMATAMSEAQDDREQLRLEYTAGGESEVVQSGS